MKTRIAKVILKSGKDESLKRRHPWVFSGAIKDIEGYPEDGDVVKVYNNKEEFLGIGHYQNGSIAVRVFEYNDIDINSDYFYSKILTAYNYRKLFGLIDNDMVTVYRLVYGEGDNLSGLILDYYGGYVVVQCHSVGMYKSMDYIIESLKSIYKDNLLGIYDKSGDVLRREDIVNKFVYGKLIDKNVVVRENGALFNIDFIGGQKTGFFIDQRDNRLLFSKYCKGRRVLNAFSYTGGFSIYGLLGGAEYVTSIDSSSKAMEMLDFNINLNNINKNNHKGETDDVMDYLSNKDNNYDIIIIDPPAYAKHIDSRHNAIQGYKRLNKMALDRLNKGGILFTFSCSQVVTRQLFVSTVISAAIQSGRDIRIMHHLSQPVDHPVNVYHPESEYLKGLVLYVD